MKLFRGLKNLLEYLMLPYTIDQLLLEHHIAMAQKANQPKGFAAKQ